MRIRFVEICNFRKLQAVRVDFSEQTTIFVGANNSGKTSAITALRKFLVERKDWSVNDFSLAHWSQLNALAVEWEKQASDGEAASLDHESLLPFLDVWLEVPSEELHHVQQLLPTLDWDGSSLGVRLRFEPKDEEALRNDYLAQRTATKSVMSVPIDDDTDEGSDRFELWPRTMMHFLSRKLRQCFEVKAYILDPSKLKAPNAGLANPQVLSVESEPIDGDPFNRLIRIDEISAQRGLGARAGSRDEASAEQRRHQPSSKLSVQLRSYYERHLDPLLTPEAEDLEALRALHAAQSAFNKRLSEGFAEALKELESLGYPGVTDPKLTISTDLKPIDGLNHPSAIQYEVPTHSDDAQGVHRLPEESNGLGYQNLVSIVFALMSFRDERMKTGKAGKASHEEGQLIEPLHLVLIEEPEAHLHAQVQQVFINQAYAVLRKHDSLDDPSKLRTQLVVSTHSSHIAHEADFSALRYFRRMPAPGTPGAVPTTSVVNLSQSFGNNDESGRFAKRYLKATHCDLFFADAAVLVEGRAERILLPHFVRTHEEFAFLRRCYITWLEIGGSHAHRLRPLLMHLGLNTLIITDLDSQSDGRAATPQREKALSTGNPTLKHWIPNEESFDKLIGMSGNDLLAPEQESYAIRVAYQRPITVDLNAKGEAEALSDTFEVALVLENVNFFKAMEGGGLVAKFRACIEESNDISTLVEKLSEAVRTGRKAEFALDVLCGDGDSIIHVPKYIAEGLHWLTDQLKTSAEEMPLATPGASA
ncbi:MAG: hypothetical protein DHS20C15_28040 [Planctomycetota bacterium]|nr:MAG: hypothetical protein DHS20C15_28040 [Planctomycetota bacterium]